MNSSLAISHLEQITTAVLRILTLSQRIAHHSKEPSINLLAEQIKDDCQTVSDDVDYCMAAMLPTQ